MFNFGQQPQPSGTLNLSATGAPVAAQQSLGFTQQMQQNPMMGGMMTGMGITPQQEEKAKETFVPLNMGGGAKEDTSMADLMYAGG